MRLRGSEKEWGGGKDADGGKRRISGISEMEAIAGGGVLGLGSLKP